MMPIENSLVNSWIKQQCEKIYAKVLENFIDLDYYLI